MMPKDWIKKKYSTAHCLYCNEKIITTEKFCSYNCFKKYKAERNIKELKK